MKDVKVIIIVLLLLLSTAFGVLYFKERTAECECQYKECEEKECNCEKEQQLINTGELQRHYIEEIDKVSEGYKVLGVATNEKEYDELTKDIEYKKREYDYDSEITTNCAGGSNSDNVTNCIPTSQIALEKDYDRYVYALVVIVNYTCGGRFTYNGYYINEYINLSFNEYSTCGPCAPEYYLYEVGIQKKNYNAQKLKAEFDIDHEDCGEVPVAKKPVLYLYPEEDINLEITFTNPENLTTTYPKYENGWNVKVLKDGSIYDKNNNYYYALYWESNYNHKVDFTNGFYVTKDNAIEFLEEKLTILGLNAKERNEFIMYWLPILENNEKNLIYFETADTLNKNEPINFSIKPDTLIRIRMHVKKVDKEINIKEQELTKVNRTGFTAVEWGGVNY